jgi:hypothetical protein
VNTIGFDQESTKMNVSQILKFLFWKRTSHQFGKGSPEMQWLKWGRWT